MTRAELEARHGTPEQFRRAVMDAAGDLITIAEAEAAVAAYDREWRVAALEEAESQRTGGPCG